jgi:hypothetical protein
MAVLPNKLGTSQRSLHYFHFSTPLHALDIFKTSKTMQTMTQDFGKVFQTEFERCGPQPTCSSLRLPTTTTLFTMNMDPSSSSANGTKTEGMMVPYMHFLLGDAVIFKEWIPHSRWRVLASVCSSWLFWSDSQLA